MSEKAGVERGFYKTGLSGGNRRLGPVDGRAAAVGAHIAYDEQLFAFVDKRKGHGAGYLPQE